MKRLLLIALTLLSLQTLRADGPDGFPIIADIMHTELYDAVRFRDIHKAGFNACICLCKTPEKMQAALHYAGIHGIKVIMFSNPIYDNPEKNVPLVRGNETLWQYHLADEPKMKSFTKLKDLQTRIKRADPNAQFFINLCPNSNKEVLKSIGVEKYPDYLREYSKIEQPQISYDYYPVRANGKQGSQWYNILTDVRNESLRTGKPFWAYILCVPHLVYPTPTIGHLRLQCYVNLAYGAQGIEYFSYSTPAPTKQYDFRNGPLLRDGKKSKTYKLVKKMNAELKPVASLFWKSQVTGIEHRKCEDGEVVVSHFKKGEKYYTCYVNKSAVENVTVSLRASNHILRIRKDLKTEAVKTRYKLSAGDILIMRDR